MAVILDLAPIPPEPESVLLESLAVHVRMARIVGEIQDGTHALPSRPRAPGRSRRSPCPANRWRRRSGGRSRPSARPNCATSANAEP
jgi:hypothetical protein